MIDVSQLPEMTQLDFGRIIYHAVKEYYSDPENMRKFLSDPENAKRHNEWLAKRDSYQVTEAENK